MSIHDERSHTVKPMPWNPKEEATLPVQASIPEALDRLNVFLLSLSEVADSLHKRLSPVMRPLDTRSGAMTDGVPMMPCELATQINASAKVAESILSQLNGISIRLEL